MNQSTGAATRLRGIRGATVVVRDDSALIQSATQELLTALLRRNSISVSAIVSAIFTVTPDLVSEFPARAARELGWIDVPMLCCTEIPVPGAMAQAIRVLLHAEVPANVAVRHVYLNGAEDMRPDL